MQSGSFREAIESKSVTTLTNAIGKLAEELAYHLTLPYTEIIEFKSKEQADRYRIHFSAISRLSYSPSKTLNEGLVFALDFEGDAISDIPAPPIHELFYAGKITTLKVYGYGDNWVGKRIRTPVELQQSLDLKIANVNFINIEDFCTQLNSR
jgi:hypothetical protein